jgi:anti-sigma factor RsiW
MSEVIHPAEEWLHAYLDAEAAPEHGAALAAHLAACAPCRARLARLRALSVALSALPDEPPARDLAPAVVTALRAANRPQTASRALTWLSAGQVALAALVLALAAPLITASDLAAQAGALLAQALPASGDPLALAQAAWAANVAAAQAWPAQAQGWLSALAVPPPAGMQTPDAWTAWAVCLGAGALLWALGNGVLLRPNLPQRHMR